MVAVSKEAKVLFLSLFLKACAPGPVLPTQQITPTSSPEPTPTVGVAPIETQAKIMSDQANANFIDKIYEINNHPDDFVRSVASRVVEEQQLGRVVFYTSIPIFDESGNLAEIPGSPEMICRHEGEGDRVQIIVNSNVYGLNPESVSPEATAAGIDECLRYRDNLFERYQKYHQEYPDVPFLQAVGNHLEWAQDASMAAWYQTTGRIIAPYRSKMPEVYLETLIDLHDRCGIDFSQHEEDPAKAERDWLCWQENYPKNPLPTPDDPNT